MSATDYVGRYRIKWPHENDAAVKDLLKDCKPAFVPTLFASSTFYEGYATLTEEDLMMMRLTGLYQILYKRGW